jgi:hypothetical protein
MAKAKNDKAPKNTPAANTAPAGNATVNTPVNMTALAAIVQATQANSFVYTTPDVHGPMVIALYAETNAQMQDPSNPAAIATRATAAGVEAVQKAAQEQQPAPQQWGNPTPTNPNPAPFNPPQNTPAPQGAVTTSAAPQGGTPVSVKLEAGIPIPEVRRGGGPKTKYPFETMEVGQSFFLANPDGATAAKTYASTVASANKRLTPKFFVIRSVDETAAGNGKGARIWRSADKPAEA